MQIPYKRPVPLTKSHETSLFDCGKEPLNDYLKRYALQNQAGGSARTYVLTTEEERVIGYYSLAPGSVVLEEAPSRVSKGQARYPIPIILMARFAIDKNFQGQGLGRALFFDALTRSLHASEEIGGRAFAIHAKDEEAALFYAKFDMEPSPENARHLFLLFKDVRRVLGV
jgi:GNAT superfamily N-acetyltransferase